MHRKHRHDPSGDLVLDGKGVFEFAIVALGPAMGAGRGVDKLGSDADAVAGAANAALQHVARAKLAPDLPHVDGLALVPEARVAGDDEQLGEPRQLCDDVLGDAVAEVFLIRVAAHAGEGENGDRRPFSRRSVKACSVTASGPLCCGRGSACSWRVTSAVKR